MLDNITEQIVTQYSPNKIMLFGSQAKGRATAKSDIDLCVVVDTQNKRRLIADMYYTLESEKPVDILIYTPNEWEECVDDTTSFAYKIKEEGVALYG